MKCQMDRCFSVLQTTELLLFQVSHRALLVYPWPLVVLYLTTFLTPTLLFLHFLDNQTFKFKNMLE